MNKRVNEVIRKIAEIDGVVEVLSTSTGMELLGGRILIPLNVYLKAEKPLDLGVHVKETISTEDTFGGK